MILCVNARFVFIFSDQISQGRLLLAVTPYNDWGRVPSSAAARSDPLPDLRCCGREWPGNRLDQSRGCELMATRLFCILSLSWPAVSMTVSLSDWCSCKWVSSIQQSSASNYRWGASCKEIVYTREDTIRSCLLSRDDPGLINRT